MMVRFVRVDGAGIIDRIGHTDFQALAHMQDDDPAYVVAPDDLPLQVDIGWHFDTETGVATPP